MKLKVCLSLIALTCVTTTYANQVNYKDYKDVVPVFTPSFYAEANVGLSITHDKAAVGSGDSVTQIGPGWSAALGYHFAEFYKAILSGELGFIQYHPSSENTPTTNVANTEHFATYLAAVGQYGLPYNFGILGKIGLAYSYAKKVFVASGASASANDYSLFWGLGVSYNITKQAAFILQWNRVVGDHKTGSTDFASLGVSYDFS